MSSFDERIEREKLEIDKNRLSENFRKNLLRLPIYNNLKRKLHIYLAPWNNVEEYLNHYDKVAEEYSRKNINNLIQQTLLYRIYYKNLPPVYLDKEYDEAYDRYLHANDSIKTRLKISRFLRFVAIGFFVLAVVLVSLFIGLNWSKIVSGTGVVQKDLFYFLGCSISLVLIGFLFVIFHWSKYNNAVKELIDNYKAKKYYAQCKKLCIDQFLNNFDLSYKPKQEELNPVVTPKKEKKPYKADAIILAVFSFVISILMGIGFGLAGFIPNTGKMAESSNILIIRYLSYAGLTVLLIFLVINLINIKSPVKRKYAKVTNSFMVLFLTIAFIITLGLNRQFKVLVMVILVLMCFMVYFCFEDIHQKKKLKKKYTQNQM